MSDMNTTDTRPAWMLDPTITEVDEEAIAAIGNLVQETNDQNVDAASAFLNRGGREDEPVQPGQGGSSSTAESAGAPTIDAPSAGGALPASDPTTDAGAAPTTDQTSPPASTITVNVPGASPVELNQEQVLALMQQYQWLREKPQEVLQAWGGIESGTHQAVPSTEYAAFQAWKHTNGTAQPIQRHAQRPVDLRDVDPDVAEYIQRLEQTQTQADAPPYIPSTPQPQPQASQPASVLDTYAAQQVAVDRQVRMIQARDELRTEYMKEYGLNEGQMAQFEQAVVEAKVIPAISQRHQVMNPLGTAVLQEADPSVVFREAFDAVMAIHPTYKAIRDEAIYNRRLAQDAERNKSVNNKKAAAGSLAHIPSAAVSAGGNSKTIEQMTPQERQEAMVAEIAQLISSGESAF